MSLEEWMEVAAAQTRLMVVILAVRGNSRLASWLDRVACETPWDGWWLDRFEEGLRPTEAVRLFRATVTARLN